MPEAIAGTWCVLGEIPLVWLVTTSLHLCWLALPLDWVWCSACMRAFYSVRRASHHCNSSVVLVVLLLAKVTLLGSQCLDLLWPRAESSIAMRIRSACYRLMAMDGPVPGPSMAV